jgi:glucosamine-6-phosphate deaminase
MQLYAPTIVEAADAGDLARKAVVLLMQAFGQATSPLVILPSGATPLGLYRELSIHHANRRNIWDKFRYLELDEYIGLDADDRRLFQHWIGREFLDRVGVPAAQRTVFQSDATDQAAETARIERWIGENGPPDVAVLGLGGDGHIGFNMPGSAFDSQTRIVRPTKQTIAANEAYWHSKVPLTAYTLGLGTLSTARQTFLLVSGAHKANILHRTLQDPVSPALPATWLRTRPNVTIVADRAALGLVA